MEGGVFGFLSKRVTHLVSQSVERRSFGSVKAFMGRSVAKVRRRGVGLDDDVSTVVGPSFSVLSERQFVALDL